MAEQEKNEKSNVSKEQPQAESILKSKLTRLQETIDAIQAQRGIQRPGPFGPDMPIHRIRNEMTEKDLPEGKFCDGQLVSVTEHATVLDSDITCPKCLEVIRKINDLKIEEKLNPDKEAETESSHEDNYTDKLDVAAEKAIDIISELKNRDDKKLEMQQAQIDVLLDITEVLKNIAESLNAIDVRMETLWTMGITINRDA